LTTEKGFSLTHDDGTWTY